MAREKDDLAATERALGRARMECDVERDRAKAVQQDYQARMRGSTTSRRHSLYFDRVLSGRQFTLSMREVDLERREVKLTEEQARGLYSFDGRDLSVELEELHERVAGVENKCAAEAVQLSWSVMEISNALVDLGMFPIRDIPVQPRSS
jgi:hypothetical protein